MKNLRTFMLVPGLLLALQISVAQSISRLNFSNPYPERNEKVSFTYAPGSDLTKETGKIEGTAWFIEDAGYPSVPITIEGDGKSFKGTFTVSAGARAFFIKINNGATIDNNDGKGFISLVYKDQKPIEGAYASNAFIVGSGIGTAYAKITRSADDAIALYNKEFELYKQSEKKYAANYYSFMAANPANAPLVSKKAIELSNSKDENDQMLAVSLYRNLGKTASVDSLTKIVKSNFPMGRLALNDEMAVIMKEKNLAKQDSLFKKFLVTYKDAPAAAKDGIISNMLSIYLKNGDTKNFDKYSAILSNKQNLVMILNNAAWSMATSGEKLAEAEKLSKQSIDIILSSANVISPDQLTKENGGLFSMCGDTYAYILWKEGKFDEALKYQSLVYARGSDNTEIVEHYVQILNSAKQHGKALEIAEASIRSGKSTAVIEDEFKAAYPKAKGNMAGFDAYWANVQKTNNEKKEQEKRAFEQQQKELLANVNSTSNLNEVVKLKQELSNKMIKEAAPLFALKDLNGKTVSLAELKGKTVIVDFWATWCGPCVQSFPGMQIAQTKYKSNPNIVFLFIDTWETGTNYLPGVKKFIADKGYNFHVLMDETGADKKQSKVVSSFKVDGIPTKFIIDKNGDIRFKYVGYSGSTERVVNEVTAMIEMIDDPKYKNATPATSVGAPAPPKPVLNK